MLLRAITDSPIFNRKKAQDGAANVLIVLLCLPLLLAISPAD